MAVAGQIVVGDRRAFSVQVLANPAVPDLTQVVGVYLYVLHANGTTARWVCAIAQQAAGQLTATYAPVQGDDDVAGDTLHVRPYLQVSGQPDTPCGSFEIQVVAQ